MSFLKNNNELNEYGYGYYYLEKLSSAFIDRDFYGKYSEMEENAKVLIVIGDELDY